MIDGSVRSNVIDVSLIETCFASDIITSLEPNIFFDSINETVTARDLLDVFAPLKPVYYNQPERKQIDAFKSRSYKGIATRDQAARITPLPADLARARDAAQQERKQIDAFKNRSYIGIATRDRVSKVVRLPANLARARDAALRRHHKL